MERIRPNVKYVIVPERYGGLAGYVKGWWYVDTLEVKLINGDKINVPRKFVTSISEIEYERLKFLYLKKQNDEIIQ